MKDNVCVAGIPMLNGSPIMEGYVPREDATVVTRLLDAGAEVVGKTAVPAFCFDGGGLTGYPDPQPTNPHDAAYLCGSSSNGSAVVVVTGQADMALGGDQGGSIRLPASWSGCCGHKPTFGLVPYTGIFPIELTIDHVGPMARTVADCALMLEVLAGEDGLDPRQVGVEVTPYVEGLDRGPEGLRVGVLREGFELPGLSEADVDQAVRDAADRLAGAGATVVTRLLDAGAEIVGKTAVPAFCFDGGGLTGYPDPQPVNPHRADHMAGSSSNGSVVVVVNGEADLALGGDQGGSIRLPSSWSGCCGHKPTYGLVPYTGIFPIELTIDHTGPMARTVADCALMLDVIAGEDGLDPRQVGVRVTPYVEGLDRGPEGLRVGILREGFEIAGLSEADVDAAVRDAAESLAPAAARDSAASQWRARPT